MIQYIWILLLFGSSYVSITHSELTQSTTVVTLPVTESLQNGTTDSNLTNRNNREARLLEGETMGGLTNCESFEIGNKALREFYSPNYPKLYNPQATCTLVLKANNKDEQVILDFRDQFEMEPSDNCKFDRLEIRDGSYGYSPIMDKYCGKHFPPLIRSSGSSLWLRFQSDDSIEYTGFRAKYWFEKRKNVSDVELNEQACVINRTESDGDFRLSTKDIPQEFLDRANKSGIDCLFRILVEKGKMVSLSWEDFTLEFPNDCDLNYVYILEENSDTIKTTFCGAAAEPILFDSNLMQIQYVAKKAAINSSFEARFTAFRKGNCTDDEFNCQDNYCIDKDLQCNDINNCLTASDEDDEECKKRNQESIWIQITKIDLLIILVVFFLILFGMCFTLIFNIVRKLIHDFSVIKEHVNQSRESQLDQLGRKTPTATLLTPMATVLPNLPDSLVHANEIRASINVHDLSREEDDNDCYVPTEHTFPNLIRHEYGFERINGGPQYHHNTCQTHRESSRYNGDEEEDGLVTQSGDYSYMPEMRDNECQTRESLFRNASEGGGGAVAAQKSISMSPSPPRPPPGCTLRRHKGPAPAPMAGPPIGFTTFGYQNNEKPPEASTMGKATSKEHRFRAEAVIEVERFKKSPKHDSSGGDGRGSARPYSVQSTKSAPDVIVTH